MRIIFLSLIFSFIIAQDSSEVSPPIQDISDPSISGCTDSKACNYNDNANKNDGSCTYAEINYNCDGKCIIELDCNGICGGDNSSCTDKCGVLNGDNSSCADCRGVPNGNTIVDCAGICGGSAEEDNCGICNGDGSGCLPYRAVDFLIVSIGLLSFAFSLTLTL